MNTAEFAEQFPGWRLVGAGADNLIAVRDFTDQDSRERAVGVNRLALVVFREPYNENWDFYRSGSIYAAENGSDLTSLTGLFGAEACREIGAVSAWFRNYTG
ncbi:MAG: hypothetical protein ACOX8W_08565 [bacterium]|jgi:hypothetical protein